VHRGASRERIEEDKRDLGGEKPWMPHAGRRETGWARGRVGNRSLVATSLQWAFNLLMHNAALSWVCRKIVRDQRMGLDYESGGQEFESLKRTVSTSEDERRRITHPPSRSEMLELSSGADRLPTEPPTWVDCGQAACPD
jgi:hypothetical protein